MPSRSEPTAVAANGQKTLSPSEVLAYSKNRFVEHGLRHRVQQLSDQQQECHDRHQQERVRWRHFMRQSSRTTGVWSDSLRTDQDPGPEAEDQQDGGAADQQGEDPLPPRASPRGNPSTELARSLMFRNEALRQLQKPWVYSYSEASHNATCKDALEVARVKEKRLLFRRAASAMATWSLPDPRTPSRSGTPRAPSSRGESRQQRGTRSTRPLTGRSTPGFRQKSASGSTPRLTASASVHKDRPKTSAGVVRVTPRPHKVAWTDRQETRGDDCQQNPVNGTEEAKDTGLTPSDSGPVPDRAASQHVTTVFRFTDNGESVEISTNKEEPPKEVKLPTVKRRKHGVVVSPHQLLQGVEDALLGTPQQDRDSADNAAEHVSTQAAKHANKQVNIQPHDERFNQQTNDVHNGGGAAASQVNGTDTTQTAEDSSDRTRQAGSGHRLQNRVAVWKQRDVRRRLNSSESSGLEAAPSLLDDPTTKATLSASHDPSSPGVSPSQNPAENREHEPPTSENQEVMHPKSEFPDDKHQTSVPDSPSTSRSSDWRARPSGPRMNGTAEHQGVVIHAVPAAHSAVRRRGSFMKIVEQLEALKAGNRRRQSVRVDNDSDPQPEEEQEDGKPDNDPTANTVNDPATTERESRNNTRHKFSRVTTAVAVLKSFPERQTDSKPASQQLDKIEEAPHTTKPVSDNLETQKSQAQSSSLDEDANKAMVEFHSEHLPLTDLEDDADFYPSNVRSFAGSDYTTFKGHKIRNYVRPQLRYRTDPFLSSRREKSLVRLSIEYPVYLHGYRGDLKSQMLFPKTCRQKVLQELVHRNHQPLPVQDNGVVPPELKAKIDEFFKTIEHYCPKPEIILDQ